MVSLINCLCVSDLIILSHFTEELKHFVYSCSHGFLQFNYLLPFYNSGLENR